MHLDSVQHQSLKIITQALKGTSLLALQNDLGQLPLHLERKRILFRHIGRTYHDPINTVRQVVMDYWHNHYGEPCGKESVLQQCTDIMDIIKSPTFNRHYPTHHILLATTTFIIQYLPINHN